MDRHLRTATVNAELLHSDDLAFLDRLVQVSEQDEQAGVLAGGDGIEYSIVLPEAPGARRYALTTIRESAPTSRMARLLETAVASDVDVVRFAPPSTTPPIPSLGNTMEEGGQLTLPVI